MREKDFRSYDWIQNIKCVWNNEIFYNKFFENVINADDDMAAQELIFKLLNLLEFSIIDDPKIASLISNFINSIKHFFIENEIQILKDIKSS